MSRKPKTRVVQCPRCDTAFEVAQAAMSMLCPGCHKSVRTEDLKVEGYWAGAEFHTTGDAVVERASLLAADVRVTNLVVKGEVKGPVHVRERLELAKTGKLIGDVRAKSIAIELGAVVIGRVEITPK